jgi:hypothetical protein
MLFFVLASYNKPTFNSLDSMPLTKLEFYCYKLLNSFTNNYLSGSKKIS